MEPGDFKCTCGSASFTPDPAALEVKCDACGTIWTYQQIYNVTQGPKK